MSHLRAANLRQQALTHLFAQEWEPALHLVSQLETNAATESVALLVRGSHKVLVENDVPEGLKLLDQSAALGDIDGQIEALYIRCLSHPEPKGSAWQEIEKGVEKLLNATLSPEQEGKFLYSLEVYAEWRQRNKEFEMALPLWSRSLLRKPENGKAFHRRSRCHFHLGDLQKALADGDAYVRIEPKNRLAYLGRAAIKKAIGDHLGAQADERLGAAFHDMQHSDEIYEQLATLLAADKSINLGRRYRYFEANDLPGLSRRYANLISSLTDDGWSIQHRAHDGKLQLTYTVGLY